MSKDPSTYEGYLQSATYKACAALWRSGDLTQRHRTALRDRHPQDWRLELEQRGYGRYDEDYIKEAITQLSDKLGPRAHCANCGDELVKGRCPRYGCPSVAGEFVGDTRGGRE